MQKGGSEETLSLKNMNLVPTSNAAAAVSSSKRHSNMEKVELTSLQRAEYWPIVRTEEGDFIYNQRDGGFDMRSLNSQDPTYVKVQGINAGS